MFKQILLGLLIVVVGFIGYVAMQSDEFYFSRSVEINAPAARVFPHVNNLKAWEDWLPWAKLDPNSKVSYAGTQEGIGSVFAWEGNDQVGVGKMTIIESKPNELVKFRLDFEKPMKGTNEASFIFSEADGKTRVTWAMYGKNGFFGKLMKVIGLCEKFMGEQFNKGLSQLKAVAEK